MDMPLRGPLRGIVSPLTRTKLRRGVSAYAIAGFDPALVLDFEQEYYRTGGTQTTFDSAMTLDRDGNATMHDGTALKWAPHNLLTYSEDLTGADWVAGGAATIVDETTIDFTAVTSDYANSSSFTPVLGASYTIQVELSSDTDDGEIIDFGAAMVGQTNSFTSPITLTSTPTVYSHSVSVTSATTFSVRVRNIGGTAKRFTATNFRIYRSDLGGMVDNPDTGNSYVPTTSAARYLPRRGHHVYNGAEWVNEGVLVEPSAGTNLITYSEDFTDASWAKNSLTANFVSSTNPAGENSVVELVESSTDAVHFAVSAPSGVGTGYYTWSLFAKLGTGTRYIQLRTAGAGVYANFDLSTGVVVDSGGPYIVSANIVDFGNGWYRCVVIGNFGVAPTGAQIIMSNGTGAAPSYLGDGTSSILIYGAQFEQGSVPSSYIPTSGSTVTRAADTLTVPSANLPWPTPNVIGPELVTNGTFDTDLTGWSVAAGSATATYNSGAVDVERTGTYVLLFGQNNVAVEVGKVYAITYEVSNIDGLVFTAYSSTVGGAVNVIGPQRTSSGTYEDLFVAPSDNLAIGFATGVGNSFTVDNISVREIDPLAVSIQMEGRTTFADTNSNPEISFFRWGASQFVNSIYATYRSDAERLNFVQYENAVPYLPTGAVTFTPGIAVPFNIASRHGSTFVNGAVDGTALTANTTPTALPDLSTTDLSLAYSGGPMILKKVRIWAADIEDAGIAEAST